jgi:hypothetical protein
MHFSKKYDSRYDGLPTPLSPGIELNAGEGFIKRPEYAGGMVSKLIAVDLLLQEHDYAGILSADADGDQFSKEAIGRLGHCHIDAIWRGLELHPFLAYIVGTATDNSFGTRLSCLRRLCGLEPDDRGPLDWIWGPCWMVQAAWGRAFLADAREMTRRLLDSGLVFHDEHILNCTYNQPKYDANPIRGMRDLGEIALIGYRAINPEQLVRYHRWREGKTHAGRAFRNRENFSRFPVAYRE